MVQVRKSTGQVQSFDANTLINSVAEYADNINVELSHTKNNRLVNLVLEKIQDREIVEIDELNSIIALCLDEVDYRIAEAYRKALV